MNDESKLRQEGASDPGHGMEARVLSFSCTHCGKALNAPPTAAGVVAPCPTCGALTQAPAVEESAPSTARPLPQRGAAVNAVPVPPVPGVPAMPAPGAEGGQPAAPAAPVYNEAAAQVSPPAAPVAEVRMEPGRRRPRRSQGAINPVTGLSADYEDRKEVGVLIRIFLAVILTAAIAFGVFYVVKRKIYGPVAPSVPSRLEAP